MGAGVGTGRALLEPGRRIVLCTGKGGVGKSTVVAGVAVAAARAGHRPLIVELGHRATMRELFRGVGGEAPAIGHEPVEVVAGGLGRAPVHAMNIDTGRALFDYVHAQVRVRRLARGITGNATLGRLFRAAPAVREVVTLSKLRQLERARIPGPRGQGSSASPIPRWSPILVDLDSTGHALMILDLPRALGQLVRRGPMRRVLDGLTELFTDPERTLLALVTLPGEVPVQETIELHDRLRAQAETDDGGVSVGALIVNQVPDEPLTAAGLAALDAVARAGAADPRLARDIALGREACERHRRGHAEIRRLEDAAGIAAVRVPRLELGRGAPSSLKALAAIGGHVLEGRW